MALKFSSSLMRLIPLGVACCGLCACGGSGSSSGPAPVASMARGHSSGGGDDMVEAVGPGHDTAALSVKFVLDARPVAGQPLGIRVRLIPFRDLNHVEARLHADEGVELRSGVELAMLDHLVRDVPVDRNFTAVFAHDGVNTLQITVTSNEEGRSVSSTYVIPVIVEPVTGSAPEGSAPGG